MWRWPRKHRFLGFICIHCDHTTGLDPWQLREMPRDMAECPNRVGAPPFGPFELMFGSVDCYIPSIGSGPNINRQPATRPRMVTVAYTPSMKPPKSDKKDDFGKVTEEPLGRLRAMRSAHKSSR